MAQKEYLKMADYFYGEIDQDDIVILDCGLDTISRAPEEAAAHAINSHDELVAEVQRLRSALSVAASAFDKLQLKEYGKNSFMVSRGEMKEFAAHHFSIATAALNYDK